MSEPTYRGDHITKPNQQIDLTDLTQEREQDNADTRTRESADCEDDSHLEIDIAPARMGQDTRDRGGNDLVGFGGNGHSR